MQPTLSVSYFSDVLCVWAYVAQIRLDELQRKFGDQICVEFRFLHLFGDVAARIETGWGDKGGAAGYLRQVQCSRWRCASITSTFIPRPGPGRSARASWC